MFRPNRTGRISGMLIVSMSLLAVGCSTKPALNSSASNSGGQASNGDQAASVTSTNASDVETSPEHHPSADGSSSTNPAKSPSCKEGTRRSCSETPAGVHISFPHDPPVGNCKYGEQVCQQGRWSSCTGLVAPKNLDSCLVPGDDANCNGASNEGCECVDSDGDRPCGVSDVGICKMGRQSCENGTWAECQGDVQPQREVCDQKGIDEDCDGNADLGDLDCECINGSFELCVRPEQGDCRLGRKTCEQGKWSACLPRFPRLDRESCEAPRLDAHGSALGDEDCDGKVDNTRTTGKDPTGCHYYMVDKDKDGWGALGLNYNVGQGEYTFGCFCVGQVPNPSMVPTTRERCNKDCGDCETGGELVHPEVSDSSSVPSQCLEEVQWRGGKFDFDCSGTQTLALPRLAECIEEKGKCITIEGDWNQTVPKCGEEGRRATQCAFSEPPCHQVGSMVVETQKCR